jgi:hypothetical protein
VLERIPLLVGLTLIAIAVTVGSFAIGDGIRDRNRHDVLSVTGSAKRRITSDYVVWDVSVASQKPSAAAAAKQLGVWTERVRTFLREQGARDSEVKVQPISTETVTDEVEGSGEITGYRLTRTFEIRSSRVDAITDLAEQTSALLAEGVPLAAQPPQYSFTKLSRLRPQMLAEAIKDAQQRANVLVEASGDHLGNLRSVNVGVFQVTSPNSTEVSDYGVYDISTVEKDVTAVVNATFTLD